MSQLFLPFSLVRILQIKISFFEVLASFSEFGPTMRRYDRPRRLGRLSPVNERSLKAYAFVSESDRDTNRAAAGRSVCNLAALQTTTTKKLRFTTSARQ